LRFGEFELDPTAGELRRRGVRIKLQEQPLQVLLILVLRAGEVVTRDELRKTLWPSDTFVDFDHSLNSAVMRLRETLHDSAASSRFVETLPKRGYRFVAPVTSEPPAASRSEPRTSVPPLREPFVAPAPPSPSEIADQRRSPAPSATSMTHDVVLHQPAPSAASVMVRSWALIAALVVIIASLVAFVILRGPAPSIEG